MIIDSVFLSYMKLIYFGKKRERLPEEEELIKRINYKQKLDIDAIDQAGIKDIAANKAKEAEKLLGKIQDRDVLVVFDENGKDMDSLEFASFIKKQQEEAQNIIFCIGGAYGHGPEVLERANRKINLGKMIWTRSLARYMVLEQIYRAGEINSGSNFHKA